jgi:hypothetical protein
MFFDKYPYSKSKNRPKVDDEEKAMQIYGNKSGVYNGYTKDKKYSIKKRNNFNSVIRKTP